MIVMEWPGNELTAEGSALLSGREAYCGLLSWSEAPRGSRRDNRGSRERRGKESSHLPVRGIFYFH